VRNTLVVHVDGKRVEKLVPTDERDFFYSRLATPETVLRIAPGKRALKARLEGFEATGCSFATLEGEGCESVRRSAGAAADWSVDLAAGSDYVVAVSLYPDRMLGYHAANPTPDALNAERQWQAALKKDERLRRQWTEEAAREKAAKEKASRPPPATAR
jgi:hypothetical protein